jgi:hypothetical protein
VAEHECIMKASKFLVNQRVFSNYFGAIWAKGKKVEEGGEGFKTSRGMLMRWNCGFFFGVELKLG